MEDIHIQIKVRRSKFDQRGGMLRPLALFHSTACTKIRVLLHPRLFLKDFSNQL
jgi:hypothetical protein